MSKGMTINCSMVEKNNGEYELGFKYHDSEGVEFDGTYNNSDPEEMFEDLFSDLLEEVLKEQEESTPEEKSEEETEESEYIKQLEKAIQDLTSENDSLKVDLEILQRRADDAVKSSMEKKAESKKWPPRRANHPRYYSFNPFVDGFMRTWF